MKKIPKIIISLCLISVLIVGIFIHANAAININTTPIQINESKEYYNLTNGLYTKKTINGPDNDGRYNVNLELYTSTVSTSSASYTSSGKLLKDYSIQDTLSDYFEITPYSLKIYSIPYAAHNNNGVWVNQYKENFINLAKEEQFQYGEEQRKWNTPVEITNLLSEIIITNSKIVIPANTNNAKVITPEVIDDFSNPTAEIHQGNKIQINFKIQPKDSFVGGISVPTNDPTQSGVFQDQTPIQNFVNLDSVNINYETLSDLSPAVSIPLIDGALSISEDNVKIGLLYKQEDLGNNNVVFSYKGRYTNDKYTLKKNSVGFYRVFDKTNTEIAYNTQTQTKPNDFVHLEFKESFFEPSSYIVSNNKYVQFKGTGITKNSNTYLKDNITGYKRIYLLLNDISDAANVINNRFTTYNISGTDSEATSESGIIHNCYYINGIKAVKEYITSFNVIVFVPVIQTCDYLLDNTSNLKWPVNSIDLTNAFNNYTATNVFNNVADIAICDYSTVTQQDKNSNAYFIGSNTLMSDLVTWSPITEDIDQDGYMENKFVSVTVNNNNVIIDQVDNSVKFVNDILSLNNEYIDMNAYIKSFINENGIEKQANDSICNNDKYSLTLSYSVIAELLKSEEVKNDNFKYTIDEFYTMSDCGYCANSFTPQYLGYQAQIHLTDNSINIIRNGCNAQNPNNSSVFTLVGFKENEQNSEIDYSSAKILNNFAIHGNNNESIQIDTSEYKYFCVIEDISTNEINAWTWDYNQSLINGRQTSGWADIADHIITLNNGDSKTLIFNNIYNNNYSGTHYSSSFCTNIMSKNNETQYKSSQLTITEESQ